GSSGLIVYNITESADSGWVQDTNYWAGPATLSPNTTYYYRADSRNQAARKTGQTVVFATSTLCNVPGAPNVMQVERSSASIGISENSNPKWTQYSVKVATAGLIKYLQEDNSIGDTEVYRTTATWTEPLWIKGLAPNTTFTISVSARNRNKVETAYSQAAGVLTLANQPVNLTATDRAVDSIDLSWSNNSNPSYTEYDVEQSSVSENSGWQVISAAQTGVTAQAGSLDEGTAYYYRVRAINSDSIYSPYSAVFPTMTLNIPPADIDTLSAKTGKIDGEIKISWTAPGDDDITGTASNYIIKYATFPIDSVSVFDNKAILFDNRPVTQLAGSGESDIVTGLEPGVFYYISIRTQDEVPNTSGISNSTGAVSFLDLGITSACTLDDDLNGKIDLYHIIFSTAVDDSTLDPAGFDINGRSGIRFFSTGTVNNPDTADDCDIYIRFDEGGTSDTDIVPDLTYDKATGGLRNLKGHYLQDVGSGDLSESDGAAPAVISATGNDSSGGGPGIQTGDQVQLIFSESTNAPSITKSNINSVLAVTGYTWLDGSGNIDSASWNPSNVLTVTLSAYSGVPTVTVGVTTITCNGLTIKDSHGNAAASSIVLGGNFGADSIPPVIELRETQDLDSDGYIDAVHIEFSENVKDTTVQAGDFELTHGVDTYILSFSSTTNGDTDNDDDIYLTFEDGVLDTGEEPYISYTKGTLTDMNSNFMNGAAATACTDKAPPVIMSIVCKDNLKNVAGVDDDDTVIISFSEETSAPTIDDTNIDTVLALSGSHVWVDGNSGINSSAWNAAKDIFTLTLSTSSGIPTVVVGDMVTADGLTITDGPPNYNLCSSTVVLSGSFDIPDAPIILSARTVDSDNDGMIDAYHITFSHHMDDSTLDPAGFDVAGYAGESFPVFGLAGYPDTEDDEDIYITFTESGSQDTGDKPQITYAKALGGYKDIYDQDLENAGTSAVEESDGAAPVMIAANASDSSGLGLGIHTGDQVAISFSEATTKPSVNSSNIDSIFSLPVGHTWRSGAGTIVSAAWSPLGDQLTVTLSTAVAEPVLVPSISTITVASEFASIKDSAGNLTSGSILLGGNFGADIDLPYIESLYTFDLDYDGYIDAVQVQFDESVKDSTVDPDDFTLAYGAQDYGLSFDPATNGDTADNYMIYLTFTDGLLKSNISPNISYTKGSLEDLSSNKLNNVSPIPCSDKSPPAILSAVADDRTVLAPGVDSDDRVVITFSEPTNKPTVDSSNINSFLELSGSHSWSDAYGQWNVTGDQLTISFGAKYSSATVDTGDTVTVSSLTVVLRDVGVNNICVHSNIITGQFKGTDTTAPAITGYWPDSQGVGVDVTADLTVDFSELMNESRTEKSISVKLVRDKDGNDVSVPVAGTADFSSQNNRLTFNPKSNLLYNHTYRVTVSTKATDTIGNRLKNRLVTEFTTIMDNKEKNTVIAGDDITKVEIDPGSVRSVYYVKSTTDVMKNPIVLKKRRLDRAEYKLFQRNDPFAYSLEGSYREFVAYSSDDKEITVNFSKPVRLILPYSDKDDNGVIDGTYPPVRETSLNIYYLDEKNDLWVKIPSSVDTERNRVVGELTHFTVFALQGANDTDLSKSYAFPVPYMPNSGEGHTKITFTNLSSQATVNIYTVSGRLVRTLEETDGDYILDWEPVDNDDGEDVVSGVYIYRIFNDEEDKTGKLIIIR
ncbi:MAG: Ig-like domain-containing protein, partial [Elusimicrobia bacterium]|nr:Ig-like domain-containing protein [Elusimicrobiota bacterium]